MPIAKAGVQAVARACLRSPHNQTHPPCTLCPTLVCVCVCVLLFFFSAGNKVSDDAQRKQYQKVAEERDVNIRSLNAKRLGAPDHDEF